MVTVGTLQGQSASPRLPIVEQVDSVCSLIGSKSAEIRSRIAQLRKHPWFESLFPLDDPEIRKVLGNLLAVLSDTHACLVAHDDNCDHPFDRLRVLERLVGQIRAIEVDTVDVSFLWETVHGIRDSSVLMAGQAELSTLLEKERSRNTSFAFPWSEVFDESELGDLTKKASEGKLVALDHARAVYRLLSLYSSRDNWARHRHARIEIKSRFMTSLWPSLAALLVFLFASVTANSGHLHLTALAAICGALGSRLSGMRKVRDDLSRLEDLRSFVPVSRLQLLVGGILGLLVYIALESKVLNIPGAESGSWPTVAIGSFVGGFSEPFFLGIVEKIASLVEKKD